MRRIQIILVVGILLLSGVGSCGWAQEVVEIARSGPHAGDGQLQVSWESEPGVEYLLQRRSSLGRWENVTKVVASRERTVLMERIAAGVTGMWRVISDPDCGEIITQPFTILELRKVNEDGDPIPIDDEGDWKVMWLSVPGEQYLLQRSGDFKTWADVDTVTASGGVASAVDSGLQGETDQYYWRVVCLTTGGTDNSAPTVSNIQVVRADAGGNPMLQLTVVARDNVGVTGAEFSADGQSLGAAVSSDGERWTLTSSFDPNSPDPVVLQATAMDAAGNVGTSELFVIQPSVSLPAGILPLGAGGDPVNVGGLVGQGGDGALTPFTYMPDNSGGGSTTGGLRIDFPEGARIVEQGGETFIEYSTLVFGFGEQSPMQVDVADPDPSAPFGGRAIVVELPPGQTGLLPLGPLDLATLIQAAGLDPAEGIPVRLFNSFSLGLVQGFVREYGIEGAIWGLEKLGLPLPEFSGDWASGIFDLALRKKAQFPIHGEFELPELGDHSAIIKATRSKPLVLTLCPNGEYSLKGPAVIEFSNGVKITVAVTLDDPNYELSITAEGLTVPLVDSLSDILPDNPQNCIPADTTDADLDTAELCLESFREAYLRFTESALVLRPDDAPDLGFAQPPSAFDTATAIAQAWGASAFTPAATSLPLQELRELVAQFGRSASGASDFKTALEYCNELLRLRAAIDAYEANGGAGDVGDLRSDSDAALDEAAAAVVARSSDPNAISSLECQRVALELLTEIWDRRQLLPPGWETEIQAAAIDLVDRLLVNLLSGLGVEVGEFDHTNNPVIAAMNRFTALEHVRTFNELLSTGAVFGVDVGNLPRVAEALRQIFGRAFAVVDQNIVQGLLEENVPGTLLAIAELTGLVGEWAVLGGADDVFPGVVEIAGYVGQLEPIVVRESMLPRGETTFFSIAVRVRALLGILEEIPPETQALFTIIELAHGDLGEALDEAVFLAQANSDVSELIALLEAGALYTHLGNQFADLTNTVDWEGAMHLPVVVSRLGQLAENGREWALLNELVVMLMNEGDRLEGADRQASRKLYYQQAVGILNRQRNVAQGLWAESENLRNADPDSFSADAFLPGDLKVDRISGSVRYNRSTSAIAGSFAGELRLPRIDSFLTIQNASIRSAGEFEINAFGELALPAGTPTVTMTVPKKDPFHFKWTRDMGTEVSGVAGMEFSNGVFFQAGIDFDDPLYTVEVEAGGLHVDFAESLAAVIPGDIDADDIRDGTVSRLWSDYYNFLTGCVETGYRSDSDVVDPPLGTLPVFAGNLGSDVHCLIDAWSCLVLAEAQNGNLANYQDTFSRITALMSWLDSGFADGLDGFASTFGPDSEFEVAYQLARLQKLSLTYKKIADALQVIEDAQLAGSTELPDLTTVAGYLNRGAELWHGVRQELENNQTFLSDPLLSNALAKAGIDLVGGFQVIGADGVATVDFADVIGFMESAASAFAASIGYDTTSGQVDEGLVGGMGYDEAFRALESYFEVESTLQLVGGSSILDNGFVTALLDRARDHALENLGYVALSGQFFPETAADVVVQNGIARLAALAEEYPATTGSNMILPGQFGGQVAGLYDRFMQRLRVTPAVQWKSQKKLLVTLAQIDLLSQLDGGNSVVDAEFDSRLATAAGQMVAVARGRMVDDEVDLMRGLSEFLGDSQISALFEERLLVALEGIADWLDTAWPAERISLGSVLARELLVIEGLRRAHPSIDIPGSREPAVLLQLLDDRMIAVCSAEARANPLAQLAEQLLEAAAADADVPFSIVLEDEARRLLNASRLIADGYAQKIAGTDEDDKPFDFSLPEGMLVRRVFGSVFYNRESGFLKGTFGGRLEFPNEKAHFQISQATIDSNGAFSIAADTAFPLEPADNANLQITASIVVSGDDTLQAVNGGGQLILRLNDDPNNGTQTFQVGISYDGQEPGRPLAFTAMLDGIENLESIRFSDDFVLFGGSLKAVFPLAHAGEFDLLVDGQAGLFAREDPLLAPVEEGDFWAYVDLDGLGLSYADDSVVARFEGGTLTLHEEVFTLLAEQTPGGVLVPVVPATPISIPVPLAFSIGYDFADGKPVFTSSDIGEITAVDMPLPPVGFAIPGLEGAGLTLRTCELRFFDDKFPILKELDGSLTFPMPGAGSTTAGTSAVVDLTVEGTNWRLDGFPPDDAAVILNHAVTVLDTDVFDLQLLGASDPGNPPGCALAIRFMHDDATGTTRFVLEGGMKGIFEGDVLTRVLPDGVSVETASVTGCGSFGWTLGQLPDLNFDSLILGGIFRFGGEDGITIKDATTTEADEARIIIQNLQNVFVRTKAQPFRITVEGALDIANFVEFGLESTAFIWDGTTDGETPSGNNLLARFEPGGFYGALGDEALELAEGLLPLYPTLVGLRFKEPSYPLFPAPGETGLFDPTNVIVLLSGVISIPNGEAIASGSPGLFGGVDLLQMGILFDNDLKTYVPDLNSLDLEGFTLGVENLDLPFMGGLTGGLTIYNFDDPLNLYVAGVLGGESKGTGVKVLVAARPTEFMGACFELEISGTGIPLDSYSLGGILLTGGTGGINFLNGFADPCDFTAYIATPQNQNPDAYPSDLDPADSPPGVEPQSTDNPEGRVYPTLPPDPTDGLSCIDPGSFPPNTVNPLCLRHPDTDKIIFKGTNLSKVDAESLLSAAGISRANIGGLNHEMIIDELFDRLIVKVEAERDTYLAFVDGFNPPAKAREYMASLLQEIIDTFDESARAFLRGTIRSFLDGKLDLDLCHLIDPNFPASPDLYDILLCTLRQGMPCFDVTLKLAGSISYTGLSTVASITGGATLSTTGTGVIEGSVNLIGIPVANTTLALSVTDMTGAINPSFGGFAEVALGPLEFGSMSTALACNGCLENTIAAFGIFLADTYGTVGDFAAEQDYLYAVMDSVVPAVDADGDPMPRPRDTPIGHYWLGLNGDPNLDLDTDNEKLVFLGALFNIFDLVASGKAAPVTVSPEVLGAFVDNFKYFLANLMAAVDPYFCFTGQVGPKLFGFPLTGGSATLVGGSLTYGTVLDGVERFQELTAETVFSPTTMMLQPVMGSYAFMVPAFDEASMGYSLRVPAFNADPIPGTNPPMSTIELAIEDPAAFVAHQTQTLVEDAVLAFSYEMKPMGITLGNGQGRMIMPRLGSHPARPGVNWSLPYDRDNPDATPEIATRMELILAALSKGRLKDPRWRGIAGQPGELGQLSELFDPAVPPNPDPDTGYPSLNPNCDTLNSEVSDRIKLEDAEFTAMSQLDLAVDYFPHGGLIFGGEASLPKFITDLPPPEMATALTVPLDADQAGNWISAVQTVFGTYLTETSCVGQMAGYLPAPSPIFPEGLDWETATLNDFIAAIREFDYGKLLTGEIAAEIFPDDQILLTGWVDASILTMPFLRGSMLYDRNSQEFTIDGKIPSDSWLHDYVEGELHFEILPPREALAVGDFADYMPPIPPGATEEEIAALREQAEIDYKDAFEAQPDLATQLNGFLATIPTGPNEADAVLAGADELVRDAMQTIADALPRVSAVASSAVKFPAELPAELAGNLELSGNASLFAFSPGFDPEFGRHPNGTIERYDPYAEAQRKGGVGFAGAMRFNLDVPGSNDDVEIDIPDGSFALLAPTNPALPPGIAGNLDVATFSIPIPFGAPLVMEGGKLQFNTDPDVGVPILKVAGEMTPFTLGGFGIVNTSGDPLDRVGGSLVVTNDGEDGIGANLEVLPARLIMPSVFGDLGDTTTIAIHGVGDESGAFVISTDGTVSAALKVSGDLPLLEPGTGLPVGTVQTSAGFEGTLEAENGVLTASFSIPDDAIVNLPPLGLTIPVGAEATLTVSSDGLFQLDLSMDPLDFGVMRVEGTTGAVGNGDPLDITLGTGGIAADPARLILPGIFGIGTELAIHGIDGQGMGDPALPFVFEPDGALRAALTVSGDLPLIDPVSLFVVGTVQSQSGFAGTLVEQNGVTTATFTIPDDASVFLPPINQSIELGASAFLTVSSAPPLGSFQLDLTVDPLIYGEMRIEGNANAQSRLPLNVSLGTGGIEVTSGARLAVKGIDGGNIGLFNLNTLVVDPDGDFEVGISTTDFTIPNFLRVEKDAGSGVFELTRVGGVTSLHMVRPKVTLFPGSETGVPEQVLPVPLQSLDMDSSGRFYANSGVQNLNLFGSDVAVAMDDAPVEAVGTLEIGYNPGAPKTSAFTVTNGGATLTALSWGKQKIGEPETQSFNVTNTGETQLALAIEFLAGSEAGDYCVSRSGLTLSPGEVEPVSVVYLAQHEGQTDGMLRVRDLDAGAPSRTITLTAQGVDHTGAVVNVGTPTLGFGQVALGSGVGNAFAVTNTGTGSLSLEDLRLPRGYVANSHSPSLAPGETEIITLQFVPETRAQGTGTVSFKTGSTTRIVDVEGAAVDRVFLLQREGPEEIVELFMDENGRGFAIDGNGSLWWTLRNGWGWTPTSVPDGAVTGEDTILTAGVFFKTEGWIVGRGGRVYRFDEPDEWVTIEDPVLSTPTRNWLGAANYNLERSVFVGEDNGDGIIVRELAPGGAADFVIEHQESGAPLSDVAFDPPPPGGVTIGRGIAVGPKGVIRVSSNYGDSWDKADLPGVASDDLLCVDLIANGRAVAGAAGGKLFYSSSFGATWAAATIIAPGVKVGDIQDVTIDSAVGISYAVSEGGVVLTSSDRGVTWTIDAYGFTRSDLMAVERVEGVGTWVAGERGEVHFRPDDPNAVPPVSFSPERIDFGTIGVNATRERAVTLTNRGLDTVTLSLTTIGTAFSATANTINDLAPGQSANVRLLYSPNSAGGNNGRLEVGVSGYVDKQIVFLRGTAADALWASFGAFTDRDVADIQFVNDSDGFAIDDRDLFTSTDGGLTWADQRLDSGIRLRALSITSGGLIGWIVGGEDGGASRLIRKTVDGGRNFVTQRSGKGAHYTDVVAVTTDEVWASRGHYDDRGTPMPGGLSYTDDGGSSWDDIAGPRNELGFDPSAIHVVVSKTPPTPPTRVFVVDRGKLWRYDTEAKSWFEIFEHGTERVLDFFGPNSGWTAGGDERRETSTGGLFDGDWTTPTDLNGFSWRGINFTSSSFGWAVADSSTHLRILRSTNGGTTWPIAVEEKLVQGSGRNLQVLDAIDEDRAWAAGGNGTYYRYGPPLPVPGGSLAVPPQLDLGFFEVGAPQTATFVVTNVGTEAVTVESAFFDVQSGEDMYSLSTALPFTLAVDESESIDVTLSGLLPGRHDSVLRFVTDGVGVVRSTSLSGTMLSPPHVIAVTTTPPGMGIKIDGASVTTPTTLVVRSGETQPGEYAVGETIPIDVPPGVTLFDVPYAFVGWNGDAGAEARVFDFVAPAESTSLVAGYAPAFLIVDGELEPGALPGSTEPEDAPVGPWLRLSGAQLRAPEIGGFAMEGAMYFSAENIACTLGARNIRIPEDEQLPNILSVGAQAWSLAWESGGDFKFHAETPSVQVFNCQVASPASADIEFQSDGRFDLGLTLVQGFEEENGMFSIGAGTDISLAYDPAQLGLGFGLDGTFSALKLPDGTWAYQKDLLLSKQFSGGALFPIVLDTSGLEDPIDVGVLDIHHGANVHMELRRLGSGAFQLFLDQMSLDLGGVTNGFSGSVGTDGIFRFQMGAAGIGPFRLTPTGNGNVAVHWNVRTGGLNVTVPASTLSASGVSGWEDDIAFPEISFGSNGNFYKKISMPGMEFDGININSGGPIEKNYLRLKREDGVTAFRIRDRRRFFGDLQVLRFDINNSGNVSGKFYGKMTYNDIEFGEISMDYNSSASNYQFVGEFSAFGNDNLCYEFRFGSGGSTAAFCDP